MVERGAVWEREILPTFLPLVEDGRAGVVDAGLGLVFVDLAAALVDALLGHCWRRIAGRDLKVV